MASPFAPLVKEQPYISTIPFDIVAQVGQYKQGLYNSVIQQNQAKLDVIGSAQLIRPEDKQFINDRLNQTVEQMNKFGGQDLSKPTIARELSQYTSNLSVDPEISSRIANNLRAVQSQQERAEMIKKNPELYSATNDKVYQDQFNAWMNNPDQIEFNASYVPYYDTNKVWKDISKDIMNNPDIKYKTILDSNGVPMGEKEIKYVAANRIKAAMMSSLQGNGQAIGQMQINYQATADQRTPQQALKELNDKVLLQQSRLKDAQERIDSGLLNTKELTRDQDIIANATDNIKQLSNVADQISSTGDISSYFTFDKYVDDNLDNISQSLAFEQEGRTQLDDLYKLNYQRETAFETERRRQDFELKKAEAKAKAEQVSLIQNAAAKQIATFLKDGVATIESQDIGNFSNSLGKQNNDGSYPINLSGSSVYTGLQPLQSSTGIQNTRVVAGINEYNKKYQKWIKTTDGQIRLKKYYGAPIYKDVDSKGITRWYSTARNGARIQLNASNVVSAKSIEEFSKTKEGLELKDSIKSKIGVDVTDPTLQSKITSYVNSPQGQADLKYGYTLAGITGSGEFYPDGENNLISSIDGQALMNGEIRIPRKELITGINNAANKQGKDNDLDDDEAFDNLSEANIIYKISDGKTDSEDDDVYGFKASVKTNNDFEVYMEKTLQEDFTSGKYKAEQIPIMMQKFKEMVGVGKAYSEIRSISVDTLSDKANKFVHDIKEKITKIDPNAFSDVDGNIFNQAIDGLIRVANGPDQIKVMQARVDLYNIGITDLSKIETKQQLYEEMGIPNTIVPNVNSNILVPQATLTKSLQPPKEIDTAATIASKQWGVPKNLLIAASLIESNFNTNALSEVGAKGVAQFMDATAAEYDVDVTNINSSINGMAHYLKDLYDKFGSWELAIGAYNSGPKPSAYSKGKIPNIKQTQDHVSKVFQVYNYINSRS